MSGDLCLLIITYSPCEVNASHLHTLSDHISTCVPGIKITITFSFTLKRNATQSIEYPTLARETCGDNLCSMKGSIVVVPTIIQRVGNDSVMVLDLIMPIRHS